MTKFGVVFLVLITMLMSVFPVGAAANGKVVVLIETSPEANAIKKNAEIYQQKTGRQVDIQIVGRHVMMNLTTQVLMSGSGDIDLIYTGSYQVAGYAAAGVLEPIDGYLNSERYTPASFNFDDIGRRYTYKGVTYAIPFDTGAWFLYYRQDLISQPPQTWEELSAVARRFTKSLNPSSPTTYGLGYYGHVGRGGSRYFSPILWTYGGDIVDDKGNIVLDSPEGIKAAELVASWRKEGIVPGEVASWEYAEVKAALETGVAAMAAPFPNAAYPQFQGPNKDKLAITITPGIKTSSGIQRVTYQQSLVLVLNRASKNKDMGWEFIKYLSSKEGQLVMYENGITPARMSILSDPEIAKKRPDFLVLAQTLKYARTNPAVPYWQTLQEVMNIMFSKIFSGEATPEQAVKEAAAKLRKVKAESGQ